MATTGPPKFSAKGATEWTKLLADLRSATGGGTNQSTVGSKLKDRFTRIEIGLKETPSKDVPGEVRRLAKDLKARMEAFDGKDTKNNETLRKSLRDELKAVERSILKTAMTTTGTIGRQLLQSQKLKEKDAARKFKEETKENYKEIQATLSKQLLDVTESRGVNDSEQLRRLQADLAESLRALKSDDLQHYNDLSKRLDDVSKNYGVDDNTALRLESIQGLVQDQSSRKDARRDKIQKRLGWVGLGGVYGAGRSLSRGMEKWSGRARTAKNLVKNTLSGGHSRVRARSAAMLAQNERISREQDKDAANTPLTTKDSVPKSEGKNQYSGSSAREQAEGVLIQRQVKALEDIAKSTKKKGSTSSGSALVGGGSGGAGGLGDLGGKFKGMGKLGGAAIMLGRLGLVGAAAWAGWTLGGVIYEKYSVQIQDAIEVVIGVVNKSIEFASKGLQWMTEFIASPVKKIKEVGGKLKAIWDDSSFAKFFSSPDKIGAEGAQAVIAAKDGTPASGVPAGSAALASVAAKLNASSVDSSSNTNALLQPRLGLGTDAGAGAGRGFINPPMADTYTVSRGMEASGLTSAGLQTSSPQRVGVSDSISTSTDGSYTGLQTNVPQRAEGGFANPVRDSIPDAVPQSKVESTPSQPTVGPGGGGAQGPTSKGSVSSIPTFSYLDNGFFMMNAGVIG